MDPLPSVKSAFSILSREESHQRNGSLSNTSGLSKVQTSGFYSKFTDPKRIKEEI